MSQPSCKVFRRIPEDFFSAKYDNDPSRSIPLTTIALSRNCASSGCPFCTILMASADPSYLPEEFLYTQDMNLRRARKDPTQSFELCIGYDNFSCTLFYHVPPEWRIPPAELNKPWDELTLMRTWLSNCATKHPKCKQIASQGSPKRVLDVRAFANSNDIRLVDWQSVPTTAKYVTLSHCWGPVNQRPICTSKATLSDRMLRIQFKDLSMTFQDAVKICRDLDQQYLWIDSLCIIQDDREDWSQQAGAMASIYGGSFVTLAALSSADSTQGCRTRSRNAGMPKLSRYQDFSFGSQRVRILEHSPAYWNEEYEGCGSNPLRTRAWTLQERDLSLRCINFAQGQLLWQCRTMKGSSELPWHEMIHEHDDFVPLPLVLNQEEDFASGRPASQRDHWFKLVEDYSSRNLTKETDKLPALEGLASKFLAEQNPGKCIFGIWSNHLPSALLWRTFPPYNNNRDQPVSQFTAFLPRRPQVYRAPSWSWASIDGEISYECQRIGLCDDTCRDCDSSYGNFEITDLHDKSTAAFGTVDTPSDAPLQMRGNITELQIDMQPIDGCFFEGIRRLISADGTTVGTFYPDIVDDFRFMRSVYVLSIRSEPYHSFVDIPYSLFGENCHLDDPVSWNEQNLRMGLALLRAGPGEIYRRVGLVRWLKEEVFDGTLAVELSVV
ncbi:hypothetical protein COCC4DRAFT_191399 [Bipolaris maydis ATCC 48331]|uniref:Heterokaryon incompatibility domain-containing protein n=2 Tax=Cochliobolus heterostrophus TaxID=5016 RepID=M2T7N8_COCH5|nr:uncharacterized protein COCC4DRAFT_191399 [Bipolaris maydis ATCC 48331]EMD93600.1 hypothetical protein COCHEDRAFT_1132124 [Bipolaris maydis C5]KAJ5027906.1 heterokaryon incompatibility protein-domain-containing protein [Bipolaris maydis]ENI06951.1 hypothetical protein COCC4DRAFT_191399 [Bipolaris maydis ATCC 48331]KAJ5062671.1 heterokaryon incompatibility protein-domain-containing protein [Bipolaris maydis]KAJ6198941.1 heterokaryon incompatibility protein-domain-containing protein [Bipolari